MTDYTNRQPNRFSKQQQKRNRRIQLIRIICMIAVSVFIISCLIIAIRKVRLYNTSSAADSAEAFLTDAQAEDGLAEGEPEAETGLFTVCIDAGHGGKDIGSDSKGRIEKDDTLKLALALSEALSKLQIDVVMTREDDTSLYLSQRCKTAADAKADYMISLHRNKGKGNGAEGWISSQADEETIALASNILSALEEVGISRNRGIKQGSYDDAEEDYYITANAEMPACILELGFINDSEDNRLFDTHLTEYAEAIAEAIMTTYTTCKSETSQSPSVNIDKPISSGATDVENHTEAAGKSDEVTDDVSDEVSDAVSGEVSETAGGDVPGNMPDETGKNITNIVIENVEALDNECQNYGQGVHTDEENRPVTSVQYEEKYKDYQAHFVDMTNPLTTDGRKKIYLTIDEGYEYGTTSDILDVLKEKEAPATFFVTLPYAKNQPDLIRRMIAEGHVIGNHSATHPSGGLPSQDIDTQANEIMQTDAYMREQYEYSMYLFRFPAGKFSEQSLAVVNNCNYESIFWSYAYLDYDVDNQPDPAESLQKMIDRLHPGAIYLLHGQSATNAAVLGDFIDKARALGYEFCLIEP